MVSLEGGGMRPRGRNEVSPRRSLDASHLPIPDDDQRRHLEAIAEGGALPHLDRHTQEAYDRAMQDASKRSIMQTFIHGIPQPVRNGITKLASFAAGSTAGWYGGTTLGGAIARSYVSQNVHDVLFENVVKPLSIIAKMENFAGPTTTGIDRAMQQGMGGMIRSAAATLEPVAVQGAEKSAEILGAMAWFPGAIGGYIAASFAVAGLVGVAREYFKDHSFVRVKKLIEDSEHAIEHPPGAGSEDPRRQLLSVMDEIMKGNGDNATGIRALNQRQLTTLAGAGRRASISLLREATKPPEISVFPQVTEALNAQRQLVNNLITGEQRLVDYEAAILTGMLSQFQAYANKGSEIQLKDFSVDQQLWPKIKRYSAVFGRNGFNATGIPIIAGAMGYVFHPLQKPRQTLVRGVKAGARGTVAGVSKGAEVLHKYRERSKEGDPLYRDIEPRE